MAMWIKQSTAITVKLGPFVDDTDGKTAETGLTISQADVRLSKNGGDIAQKNESSSATHDELGYYDVALNTTDTNTLGRLRVLVSESGALPVWADYMVVPANVWDSLFGADKLQVHVDEMTAGIITATVIATDAIDADAIADNAINAAAIADGAITAAKIATDAIDADAIADGAITSGVFASGAITADAIAANAIGASELAADAVTEIQSGLATSASITSLDGKIDTIDSNVDSILADTGTDGVVVASIANNAITAAAIATGAIDADALASDAIAEINATVDTALADYDAPTKAELDSAVAPLATASALATVDTVVDTIAAAVDTEIPAILAAVDTEIAAILADTGTDGVVLSTATRQAIADEVLGRSIANTEDSAGVYTLTAMILAAFESSVAGTTWTINKTDGSTQFATRTVTTDDTAEPVIGVS